jgi:hypothetical protein
MRFRTEDEASVAQQDTISERYKWRTEQSRYLTVDTCSATWYVACDPVASHTMEVCLGRRVVLSKARQASSSKRRIGIPPDTSRRLAHQLEGLTQKISKDSG